MEHNFTEDVKTKSDKKLKDIVIHFENYQEALIFAAQNELANRGIELSDGEKRTIEIAKQQMAQETPKKQETDEGWDSFHPKWKQNIVKDMNAPQLYSRRVINIFSILFSVLFGGILFAINLKTVNNKKGIGIVLIFSAVYTGLVVFILNLIPGDQSVLTVILNLIGSVVLYDYFWKRYIGKEVQYRTKPFWIPLIIGIFILTCFVWLLIVANIE